MSMLPAGLISTENPDGSSDIRAEDLATIKGAIGEDGLVAFCLTFAAANRLRALASMTKQSSEMEYDGLRTRNRFTIFFLSLGVAHEAVVGLNRLEGVLKRKGHGDLLGAPDFNALRDFRRQWGESLSQRLRNKLAFHFDVDSYEAGVRAFGMSASACIVHLDAELGDPYFPLADEVLLVGTKYCLNGELTDAGIQEMAVSLWRDQTQLGDLLFDLFAQVLERCRTPELVEQG